MTRTVPAERLADRLSIGGLFAVGGFGLVLGYVARWVRPKITGGVHYEMLVAFFLLVLVCGAIVFAHRRIPWRRSGWSVQRQVGALWLTFLVGWSFLERRIWDDVWLVCVTMWAFCAIAAFALLPAVQTWGWRPVEEGRFCPQCGYDLAAAEGTRCPECGGDVPR